MERVARVGKGRRKSARVVILFILTTKYLNILRYVHCSVSLLFKGGGLDFAQDWKLNFCLKVN